MSRFLQIRNLLGLTQQEMAEVLECTQSNVSFLDRGQSVTQEVAGRLVDAAQALGVGLSFDHVFGSAPLPAAPRGIRPRPEPVAHDWAAVLAELNLRGWSMVQLSARLGVRIGTLRALAQRLAPDAPHAVGEALLALRASAERPAAAKPAPVEA